MKKRFLKTFLISFMAFVLIYGGTIYSYMLKSDEEDTISKESFLDRVLDDQDEITFLLLGVDGKDTKKNDKVRSDTMMLCKVDKSTSQISLLSIPRDTKAMIRGRKYEEKINHAHAYGGPELSMKAVKDLLGIDLDYYVRVDYGIVEEYVNLIGGVEIDVPMNMKYDDPVADPPLHINLKKGLQVLDGDKSLQFLRYRKGYKDQDLGRIRAQQTFMKALVDQSLKPANIMKIPQMVKTYYDNVDTNIPLDLIMKFAAKAKSFDTTAMHTATLPGEPKNINGISYYILYTDESSRLVKEMFLNQEAVESIKNNNDEAN
jgi:LCP family protein required for cell wall assembly